MKVAEILRAIADIIDVAQDQEPIITTAIEPEGTTVDQIAKLAGITQANTTPQEVVFPLDAAYPAGDDMHYSKNPSDIRADSISMYPGYGAKK